MGHPFTSQRNSFIIYISIWIVATAVNGLLLYYNKGFDLTTSITEASIVNVLFGLFGLIAWYPTRYIPFRKESFIYSISAHIVAGLIVIIVWLFVTVGVLGAIFSNNINYQTYLSNSIVWRGFVGVMAYLVLVLIYYVISYARKLSEKAQAEEKLRTLVKESELNMLKSQINPHFLFNSLNSISSLILSNPPEAQEMVIRLSDFLRYSLKHRENEFVPLKEEVGRMKDYLSIEQIRFGEKLDYSLSISKQCEKVKVPTMILQPLIENAIKHGVYESLDPVKVDFSCEVKDEYLQLELENDFDLNQSSRKGTGLGLQNVSERLRLAYDGSASVTFTKDAGKFRVSLFIPIK